MNAPRRRLERKFTTRAGLAPGLLSVCGALQAQVQPGRSKLGGARPDSILWVGNRFYYSNNSMHSHVQSLAHAADAAVQTHGVSGTISGPGLDWTGTAWAYAWAYTSQPEMPAKLAEPCALADNANDALVIPAGLAFARAIASRPDIGLYQTDMRHPSMRGTYLAACTAYAALMQRSPLGNAYTAGIDPVTAAFLQATAWDTVQAYYPRTPSISLPLHSATPERGQP